MNNKLIGENKIGYKGFKVDENNQLYCNPGIVKKYYKVGEVESVTGKLKMCENGIHFCWEINNVHEFYNLLEGVICKIEILGDVVNDDDGKKSCTNKIKILQILTKEEILKISNTGNNNSGVINSGDYNSGDYNSGNRNSGDYNSGYYNSGDYNSGNRNSGNRNSGNYNSGDYNSGNRNSGNRNSGNRNSGDYNSGDYNSGDYNSGDYNSGDYNSGNRNSGNRNSGNYNSGYFNTNSPCVRLFNKNTDIQFNEFVNSNYYNALNSSSFILNEWIYYTEEEKKNDKAKELIGGYLKTYEYKEACKNWWNKMSNDNKNVIKNLPNFDKNIFLEITGINVDEG